MILFVLSFFFFLDIALLLLFVVHPFIDYYFVSHFKTNCQFVFIKQLKLHVHLSPALSVIGLSYTIESNANCNVNVLCLNSDLNKSKQIILDKVFVFVFLFVYLTKIAPREQANSKMNLVNKGILTSHQTDTAIGI